MRGYITVPPEPQVGQNGQTMGLYTGTGAQATRMYQANKLKVTEHIVAKVFSMTYWYVLYRQFLARRARSSYFFLGLEATDSR